MRAVVLIALSAAAALASAQPLSVVHPSDHPAVAAAIAAGLVPAAHVLAPQRFLAHVAHVEAPHRLGLDELRLHELILDEAWEALGMHAGEARRGRCCA